MAGVTIIGEGAPAAAAVAALESAGFAVHRAAELDAGGDEPVVLGEAPNAFVVAREAIASGRHLLLASPQSLPVERLSPILEGRQPAQAAFIWSDRRHHPGYKFVQTSIEADIAWRPRFVRIESRATEPASNGLLRWRCLESLALIEALTTSVAVSVTAQAVANPRGGAPDLLRATVVYGDLEAHIEVGSGEAVERRESLFAGDGRKAFVDELDENVPLRVIHGDGPARHQSRCVSCSVATLDELARRQCLGFIEATRNASLADQEAALWQRALAALRAVEASLASGAAVNLLTPADGPRVRLLEAPSSAVDQAPVPA
jgi:hypothetical protein